MLHDRSAFLAAILVSALVVASCSAADREPAGFPAGVPSSTAPDATRADAVERPPCALLSTFDRVFESLGAPAVFDLSASELAENLTDRREAVALLRDETDDPDDYQALSDLADLYEEIDPLLVEAWESRSDDLLRAGPDWVAAALDGDDDLVRRSRSQPAHPIDGLYAECRSPEDAGYPGQDLHTPVDGGLIVFNRPVGRGGALFVTPPEGGSIERITGASGWDDVRDVSVDPTGRWMAGVAYRDGYETTAVAIGTASGGFEILYEPEDGYVACPRWSADGERVLATRTERDGTATGVITVGRDGSVTEIAVDLAEYFCVDDLSDGRLVVGFASDDVTDFGGVALAAPDGSDPEMLFRQEACSHLIGDVSPDDRILLSLRCRDPLQSGLYVLDLDGDATKLVDGLVAVPRWSPSGESAVFGFAPLGVDYSRQISAWVVRADGTGLRQVADPLSSWTAWIALDPELPGESA